MEATGIEATESTNSSFEQLESENLSSVDKYKYEWAYLTTLLLQENLEKLREIAFNGDLKVSKFRSICWALFLRVINDNPNDWIIQRRQQREKYQLLKEEFARNPHTINDINDDPLSQSKQSIWNQYFGDQELCSVIKQDVMRTFPGVDFFRKPLIQDTLINVLFYYAREHPYMCYRQGMHEILAPILFVIHSDHQAMLHFQEVTSGIDENLLEVLDPEHLEADAYALFSRLMASIESYYRIVNTFPTSEGYFPPQKVATSPDAGGHGNEIEVIGQLNYIRDKILAKEDLHLHNHLLKLDIPLHIFGIRWLRLLFGREFPLQDLLMLWDAIFADGDKFELPNFIVVAMLVRIRDKLLVSDYTTCLTYLMRYPNNTDIGMILRHALYMQSPMKYERPQGAFVYVTMKPEKKLTTPPQSKNPSSSTLPRPQASKTSVSSKKLHLSNEVQRVRSSSLTSDNINARDLQIQARINDLQYSSTLNVARLANYSTLKAKDPGIVDGYREDSPEVLRLELENAQTVMTISRLKLKKYLVTLRSHITRNHPDDLNQAVDGIEELCAFLDVKCTATNYLRHQIDPAFEVDESIHGKHTYSLPSDINIKEQTHINKRHTITEKEAKREFVRSLEANNQPIANIPVTVNTNKTEVAEKQSEVIENQPVISTISNTRYEIPDDGHTKHRVFRMLGAKKDVELTVIKKHDDFNDEDAEGVPLSDPLGLRDC